MENLKRELSMGQATFVGHKKNVKALAAGTTTLTADESGSYILFAAAAESIVTLPAPQAGLEYTFITTVTATGDHVVRTATLNTDGFLGGAITSSDNDNGTNCFAAAANGSNDFITMNGSTTGGLAGSRVHVVCIDGENWAVDAQLVGSGTTITPFGDAQI
jgi:hypothetical protein